MTDTYRRITFPTVGATGATITHAAVYDAAPRWTAQDYVRASNAWPAPYGHPPLWVGTINFQLNARSTP